MKVITDYEQGSVQWLYARAGIPTASEFHHLVTPKKLQVRSPAQLQRYVNFKLAEKWGGPLLGQPSAWAMEQGKILENEAIPWFDLVHEPIRRVGFIKSDDERIGCSPDGLLAIGGIEFKCPQPHKHVSYLLDKRVPDEYVMQVQGCMLVTGEQVWKFVSYSRKYPKLVLNVQRDEAIMEALSEALDYYHRRFALGWDYLCELNGGPPEPVAVPEKMVFADDIAAGRAEDPDSQTAEFDIMP